MREIKFRAWYHAEQPEYVRGKQINPDTMLQVGDTRGTTHSLDCCRYAQQEQPVTLMQFIGLRDKNGKEIYEGDITRHNYHQKEPDTDFIMDVIYDDRVLESGDGEVRCVGFILRGLDRGEYWYRAIPDLSDFEVIGNIYENPELLERQK